MLLLTVICLSVVARTTWSFNIEIRNPIVKIGAKDSYFGFSVAEHWIDPTPGTPRNNWILVGAPLGRNLQPNTNRSGALYKCPITRSDNDCEQVPTDGGRDEEQYDDNPKDDEDEGLQPPGNDEIKDGQWLGVTVKSQKPGGKVMTCAHRYIQSDNLATHRYGMGLCYILTNGLELQEHLQPCENLKKDKLHEQFGFCQVGTSLAILDDDYALMGSPGPFTWRGTVFARPAVANYVQNDMNYKMGPLNDQPDPIDKYSYLGMSVAGGNFFKKKELTYASGAPRSRFTGQVYFLERRPKQDEMNITCIISGEQFASSFGYEILALDVDHDGYDDLLVGAPFFFKSDAGGAVYVYTKLRECCGIGCKPSSNFTGLRESRFGFSMTSLGDINRDGWVDVAIGAPYEGNFGAVYIYLGSPEGLNAKPSQIIRTKIATHGYSLSGGLDMDNNGYPDLLVGAYESDRVILYKTRPIIDIKIDIVDDELKNINITKKECAKIPGSTNACFTFQTCFTLSELPKNEQKLEVKYEIRQLFQKYSRIWFHNPKFPNQRQHHKSDLVTVRNSKRPQQLCDEHTFLIKDGVTDILTPIKFIVNYTFANNSVDSPILNKTSVREFEATFQKSCGEDDICESNLNLQAGSHLKWEENHYILDLGKNQEFILDANVSNTGESAYEAKLFVVHPDALSYIALQTDREKTNNVICEYKNETLVVCNLGNPFQHRADVHLKLRFEIKNTKQPVLNMTVFVNSTSKELSTDTKTTFRLVLQKIALFSIRQSSPYTPNVVFSGDVKGQSAMHFFEDIGARVNHTYQITNEGEWNIQDVVVRILWPYQVYSNRKQGGKWLLYLERSPEVEAADTKGIKCWVQTANVVNPLQLNSSGIEVNEPANFTMPAHEIARRKRDTDDVIQPETESGQDGKPRKVVTMDCAKGTALCAEILCTIKSLSKVDPVKIKIRSRIWNSTLVEDYSKVDLVVIRSVAEVIMNDNTIKMNEASVSTTGITTTAYPGIVQAEASLNIWIIIGSVLAGLVLLIILVCILYKFGFFKRNRVRDQTLSGNLQKQGENENLLTVNEPRQTS